MRPFGRRRPTRGTAPQTLAVEGLSVQYGGVTAVSGVSFEAPPGSCTMILGANGAGKTSLLRGISGFERCAADTRIRIGDTTISSLAPAGRVRAGLAHCLQDRNVFPNMTVEHNLEVAAVAAGSGVAVEEALEAFPDLRTMLRAPAGALSGGQQQFLAVARCLMLRPTVIMLDEPSNGLAPMLIDRVCEVVEDLTRGGLAVLVVEQRLELAAELADRVLLMANGRIVEELSGSDADLVAKAEAVYLGDRFEPTTDTAATVEDDPATSR
ncbi:ABC transporter ATP-binding protein [Euzebya sp.]|uniref:ABC transporter ATP-binding protein n=1 Tax=Euzebya sp. TaxID=1971409 RepID=UPI0035183B8E